MICSIIEGICSSIQTEFGSEYEVYTENTEQGLTKPCFLVSCFKQTNSLFMDKRYFRSNIFCIQYFPQSNAQKGECYKVLERLFDCLEYLDIAGSLTRGTKMQGELVDHVLNFFVNFDGYVYKTEEKTKMGELKQNGINVKG